MAKYASELRTYSAYLDYDASERFAGVRAPTLVLWGTADAVFDRPGWDALLKDRPTVRYRPVEGAGHGRAVNRETLEEILAFLLRVDAEG